MLEVCSFGLTRRHLLLAVILWIHLATEACSGKFNKVLSVGDRAPGWINLPGVDGKSHGLADCKRRFVVVVLFANHCPVCAAYEERFKTLADDYRMRDVELIAISVSRGESDRLEKMKERARDSKLPFPYLLDESQETGHQFGATTTPQIFVLDAERRVAYMGAFDDHWKDTRKVEMHYTRDALNALLAGEKPEIRETRPVGCAIEYQRASQNSKPE